MSSSAILTERHASGSHAGAPAWQPAGAPAAAGAAWCVVPRCDLKFAKCDGGFHITCRCEDEVATATLHNLCKALAGGLCNCGATFNGIAVCQCNFACGHCHCEYNKNGVKITCTSGDDKCCEQLQACCECLKACCDSGCCCTVSFGNTPVCCSTC
ncbi:MAG TPA: hypothetical protein VG056_15685 [Pirellulales bacterium]|nr:hypothetical protein [Pirellulales bacterium]